MTRAPEPLRLIIIAAVLVIVAIRVGVWLRHEPPRPIGTPPFGTAALSGVVVDDAGTPMKGASVSIRQDAGLFGLESQTDEAGRFAFTKLPAGSYSLDAGATGAFNRNLFTMTGVGFRELTTTLAEGQAREGVTLRIARGGTIEGVVRDEDGQPAAKRFVRAMRRDHIFDQARLEELPIAGTDEQGRYHVTGAPPGDYIIMAALDPSAVRRVYYPEAARVADATAVTLAFGETKTGIDLRAHHVPMSSLTGRVTRADGAPVALAIDLVRAGEPEPDRRHLMASSGADGRFAFADLPADRYWLVAHSAMGTSSGAEPRDASKLPLLWGLVSVTTDGRRTADVAVRVDAGRRIAGTFVFDPTSARTPPTSTDGLAARLVGRDERTAVMMTAGAFVTSLSRTGEFAIDGVPAGSYGFAPALFQNWWVESIAIGGTPVPDGRLDVTADRDLAGVSVSLVDKAATIAGVLHDAAGTPVAGRTVVAFAADAALWQPWSNHVRAAGTNLDGEFSLRYLAAGEYLVAALDEDLARHWRDRPTLEALRARAVRLTLATSETKTIDLAAAR